MYKGIDTAAKISSVSAKKLKSNGISFVARYLVPKEFWKALTEQEIKDIHDAGLAIMLCWEIGGEDAKGGREKGSQHGAKAKEIAKAFGVPDGTAIYFTCDFCADESDYPAIESYIRAAQQACYPYEAGMYGHAMLVDYLASKGACKKFWQCAAWSYGRLSQYATVYQYAWSGDAESQAMQDKVGFAVDMDKMTNLDVAGLWMPKKANTTHNWYDVQMQWAKDNGIINDGRPNDAVTRAELATILYRIFGPEDEKEHSGLLS